LSHSRTTAARQQRSSCHCVQQAILTASLAAVLAIAGCSRVASIELTEQQRRQNVASFEQAWSTVRDTHWDPQLLGLDWQAIHDELEPKVEQASSMASARAVMTDMVSRLGQSHFRFIPSDVYDDVNGSDGKGARDGDAGLDVRIIDSKPIVTSVRKNTPAADLGVCPGWEIVEIDGELLAPMLAKMRDGVEAGPTRELMMARAVLRRLIAAPDETVSITFLDGDDRSVEKSIELAPRKGKRLTPPNLPPRYVWLESRKLDDRTGYIAFNCFFDPVHLMPAFGDAVKSFRDMDAIIIDLRGNPGGVGAMSMGMAGWFFDEKNHHLGTMHLRHAKLKFVINPRAKSYRGRVAILVDGHTGSTAEIFAGGMKDLGRAVIIGTRTVGAALPSTIDRLPNGDGFQHAVADYISVGGEALEANGVIPDIQVAVTRDSLLDAQDPILDAAVEWAHESAQSVTSDTSATD